MNTMLAYFQCIYVGNVGKVERKDDWEKYFVLMKAKKTIAVNNSDYGMKSLEPGCLDLNLSSATN